MDLFGPKALPENIPSVLEKLFNLKLLDIIASFYICRYCLPQSNTEGFKSQLFYKNTESRCYQSKEEKMADL